MSTTLYQLALLHHQQAAYMAMRTLKVEPRRDCIEELKRHGNKFTTRVEKRLRKMESRK